MRTKRPTVKGTSPMETMMNIEASEVHELAVLMSRGTFGGFAAKLADAWFVADSGNRQRIEMSFPELFWKAKKLLASEVTL